MQGAAERSRVRYSPGALEVAAVTLGAVPHPHGAAHSSDLASPSHQRRGKCEFVQTTLRRSRLGHLRADAVVHPPSHVPCPGMPSIGRVATQQAMIHSLLCRLLYTEHDGVMIVDVYRSLHE